MSARITVRRSARPLAPGASRATRLGGLVVRSGRAAHESTLASQEGLPGTCSLYGEVRCNALEELQRDALGRPRPQVVVKVDRSGLNETHPVVKALYAAIDRVLRPIVVAEERRAGAHLIRPGGALRARDQIGLRALNDALNGAFDAPGRAGFEPGSEPSRRAPATVGAEANGRSPGDPAHEPPSQRMGARDRAQGRGRRGGGPLRPRERGRHRLRGAPGVQGSRTSCTSSRLVKGARARLPPLPDARSRGRRRHGVRLGRGGDPREASAPPSLLDP